jgi:hypothetical protein
MMKKKVSTGYAGPINHQRHLTLSDEVWRRLRVTAAIKGIRHSELAEEILAMALARMGHVVDDGSISLIEK